MSRIKKEMRETVLGILRSGVETTLTTRDLNRLGIDIPVPTLSKSEIKRIRVSINASQDVFAKIIGTSKSLVSQWEQGAKSPNGSAAVLLKAIQQDPRVIDFRLANAQKVDV